MEINDALHFFEGFNELDSDFMQKIGKMADEIKTDEELNQYLGLLSETQKHSNDARYACFYILFMYYRGKKQYFQCGKLIEKYKSDFKHHKTFFDPVSTYLVESGANFDIDNFLSKSFKRRCEFDSEKLSQPGYIHAFAYYYACLYKRSDDEGKELIACKWGEKALAAINRALELVPEFPTYHCTKGRIMASFHRYDEAHNLINYAIQYSDSRSVNYGIKLSSLQYYDLLIMANQTRYDSIPRFSGGVQIGEGVKTPLKMDVYDGKEPYAFISYSHKDTHFVSLLARFLQKLGYRIWCDTGIKKGANYANVIHDKIHDCELFICVISAASQKSYYCTNELSLALDYNQKILPIHIDEGLISPGFLLQIHHIQMLSQSNNQTDRSFFESIAMNIPKSISNKSN
ncbi:MAG: toll/interleukin-1 receptor domain-containing protein [Sphingobacteriia bacterium]|nr:toll/interleukin-1 receptor domain-containing protein [Sphingobacteriia bacterium]